MSNTLWGGRFTESTDSFVQEFTASVQFDQRMAEQDIQGSRAHAAMLAGAGVLSADDLADATTNNFFNLFTKAARPADKAR